ncbi:separation anxiety protein like [Radiomyces spectabilis]|uniref:separation anxiety protein like n=1 Tax=Radiomyces spectabilis TaxID=64574 RepID=UPI00221F2652|nr:separation anxiety protein like [Radiomyces spectabilis]KAI8365954.1 separation anxiety protein like [Radiomyces spectabilis]
MALGEVTANNLGQLRVLHKILFPVDYDDSFFTNALNAGELAKLAYYNDVCVGAVCCRKEVEGEQTKVYMMTLGVLKPYRNAGLGKLLLDHILEEAKTIQAKSVYLHVHVKNEDGLAFYKKHGFEVTGEEKDYYRDVEPKDAYILSKTL